MAVAILLTCCGLCPFVFICCLIVGGRGEDREQEDREQMEYLRQWAQTKRQKRERRRR